MYCYYCHQTIGGAYDWNAIKAAAEAAGWRKVPVLHAFKREFRRYACPDCLVQHGHRTQMWRDRLAVSARTS